METNEESKIPQVDKDKRRQISVRGVAALDGVNDIKTVSLI